MATIAIPKKLTNQGELVVISRKELDALIARAGEPVTEKDVLRWSREAKKMHKAGKLAKLA